MNVLNKLLPSKKRQSQSQQEEHKQQQPVESAYNSGSDSDIDEKELEIIRKNNKQFERDAKAKAQQDSHLFSKPVDQNIQLGVEPPGSNRESLVEEAPQSNQHDYVVIQHKEIKGEELQDKVNLNQLAQSQVPEVTNRLSDSKPQESRKSTGNKRSSAVDGAVESTSFPAYDDQGQFDRKQKRSSMRKTTNLLGFGGNSKAQKEKLQIQKVQARREKNFETFKRYIYTTKHKTILSMQEKEKIWGILKDPEFDVLSQPRHHKLVWLKCSGALGQMKANPGYYNALKKAWLSYPNPSFYQIELDLKRTFPKLNDPEQLAIEIVPLRNVLCCYVMRNPTVGYCQGMNFIVARLLTCMNEEEAFWTLAQTVETILPMDYYSNMLGVLIDQKVLQALLLKRLPRLCAHLLEFNFSLDLLAFQWLVCLFVNNLPPETEYAVWDMFFIKGIQVLFRVALTVLKLMESEILSTDRFDVIYQIIDSFGKDKVDKKTLLKNFAQTISNKEIEKMRQQYREEIVAELEAQIAGSSDGAILFPRLKFLNRFFLYNGLARYYQTTADLNEEHKKAAKLTSQTMDKFEKDLMQIYNCKKEWPICLFDFSFKNRNPNYLIFRTEHDLHSYAFPNYFYGSEETKTNESSVRMRRSVDVKTEAMMATADPKELLIERNWHMCQSYEHPEFIDNFKVRFVAADEELFTDQCLNFHIEDDLQIEGQLSQFIANVSKPISEHIKLRYEAEKKLVQLENAKLAKEGDSNKDKSDDPESKSVRSYSKSEEHPIEDSQQESNQEPTVQSYEEANKTLNQADISGGSDLFDPNLISDVQKAVRKTLLGGYRPKKKSQFSQPLDNQAVSDLKIDTNGEVGEDDSQSPRKLEFITQLNTEKNLVRRHTFFGDWEVDSETLKQNKDRIMQGYALSQAGVRENTDSFVKDLDAAEDDEHHKDDLRECFVELNEEDIPQKSDHQKLLTANTSSQSSSLTNSHHSDDFFNQQRQHISPIKPEDQKTD